MNRAKIALTNRPIRVNHARLNPGNRAAFSRGTLANLVATLVAPSTRARSRSPTADHPWRRRKSPAASLDGSRAFSGEISRPIRRRSPVPTQASEGTAASAEVAIAAARADFATIAAASVAASTNLAVRAARARARKAKVSRATASVVGGAGAVAAVIAAMAQIAVPNPKASRVAERSDQSLVK